MNLCENGLLGNIANIEIYDSHAHLGKWSSITMREYNEDHIVKYMDYISIKKTMLSSSLAIGSDYIAGNKQVADAINKYPDRLLGLVTINPNYKDGTVKEYQKYEDNKNILGIKIHPSYNGIPVSAVEYNDIFDYVNKKECMVLVHTFSKNDVLALGKIAEKYTDANFIFAHSGAETGVELTAELIKNMNNVYCDIPVSFARANTLEYLVEKGSPDKILFGTDSPLFDYRMSYGRVLFANISDEDKLKIFGLNFKKLLSKTKSWENIVNNFFTYCQTCNFT